MGKGDEIKLYMIETEHGTGHFSRPMYRYHSRYNSSRSPWCFSREEAIAQGEAHQKIILALFNEGCLIIDLED